MEDATCAYKLGFGGNRKDWGSRIRGRRWVGHAISGCLRPRLLVLLM